MSPELQLAALLCSRVCHDLIGPVSAIDNGLEVLNEEDDPAMRDEALNLLRTSAAQASAKLQFARLAFGSASTAPSESDPEDARQCIAGVLDKTKHELLWHVPAKGLDKERVKILMNAVLIAKDSIPRGGEISVRLEEQGGRMSLDIAARGEGARISEAIHAALDGLVALADLDPRSVQPYFTGLLVRERGGKVIFERDGDTVTLGITA